MYLKKDPFLYLSFSCSLATMLFNIFLQYCAWDIYFPLKPAYMQLDDKDQYISFVIAQWSLS